MLSKKCYYGKVGKFLYKFSHFYIALQLEVLLQTMGNIKKYSGKQLELYVLFSS